MNITENAKFFEELPERIGDTLAKLMMDLIESSLSSGEEIFIDAQKTVWFFVTHNDTVVAQMRFPYEQGTTDAQIQATVPYDVLLEYRYSNIAAGKTDLLIRFPYDPQRWRYYR